MSSGIKYSHMEKEAGFIFSFMDVAVIEKKDQTHNFTAWFTEVSSQDKCDF